MKNMNRDRQLKKDMESREVQIHEEYEQRQAIEEGHGEPGSADP